MKDRCKWGTLSLEADPRRKEMNMTKRWWSWVFVFENQITPPRDKGSVEWCGDEVGDFVIQSLSVTWWRVLCCGERSDFFRCEREEG